MNAEQKICGYEVIECKSDELSKAVASRIKTGWQPFGSPAFVVRGNPEYVQYLWGVQVMVKYED